MKLASTDHREVFSLRLTGYYLAQGPVFGFDRGCADSNSPTIIVQGKAAARTVHYILTVGSADPYRASTEGFVQQLADSASPRIRAHPGRRTRWSSLLGRAAVRSQGHRAAARVGAAAAQPSITTIIRLRTAVRTCGEQRGTLRYLRDLSESQPMKETTSVGSRTPGPQGPE